MKKYGIQSQCAGTITNETTHLQIVRQNAYGIKPRDKTPTPPVTEVKRSVLHPKLVLHKGQLAPFCARLRHRGERCAMNGRGDRRRGLWLRRNTGRFWRVLRLVRPLAAVQPFAKGLPARKPLVHEGAELRTVVVDSKMCVFMGDHVFDKVTGRTGELGVVGDVAVAPVAASPERLHPADLPRDPILSHTSRPRCVQFAEVRRGRAPSWGVWGRAPSWVLVCDV